MKEKSQHLGKKPEQLKYGARAPVHGGGGGEAVLGSFSPHPLWSNDPMLPTLCKKMP